MKLSNKMVSVLVAAFFASVAVACGGSTPAPAAPAADAPATPAAPAADATAAPGAETAAPTEGAAPAATEEKKLAPRARHVSRMRAERARESRRPSYALS